MKKHLQKINFKDSRLYILLLGFAATVWFLVRVIPKPSRARYPCMQAAAPLMSSFVVYILAISASVFSYNKFKNYFRQSRYALGILFFSVSVISFTIILLNNQKEAIANVISRADNSFPIPSNQPIGEAKGLFPGRVVWIHDNNATNENYKPKSGSDDYWYEDVNANETVITAMLEEAIKKYAGKEDINQAWDAIFKSYNNEHGRGETGYTAGEKIAFKVNLTNQSCSDYERPKRMDIAPQLMNAVLHEMVDIVGVAQADITMGDPYREFRVEYRNLVKSRWPNVYFVDGAGGNGVHKTVPSAEAVLKFSDGVNQSTLPQQYLDATYVINIPCLKTHNEGGITLIAKNHQGSYLAKGNDPRNQSAMAMHYSLPANNRGSGKYRHTVDYMGHEQTGGKALIYIIDGIWAGESWEGWISKYVSSPFNNDYPNSIFVGQDPVALESVCYDIMFEEYAEDNNKQNYPNILKTEIADYLSQCASSDYWPDGITYDPEGDGTPIGSLGVFEHWNNATDRQYTRNLGTGNGIELIYEKTTFSGIDEQAMKNANLAWPNPCVNETTFKIPENAKANCQLIICNIDGQLIRSFDFVNQTQIVWNTNDYKNSKVANGVYLYRVLSNNKLIAGGKVIVNRP